MNDLVRYTTEDGRSPIKPRKQGQTGRMTQWKMSELFAATKSEGQADRQFAIRRVANSIVAPLAVNADVSAVVQACLRGKS